MSPYLFPRTNLGRLTTMTLMFNFLYFIDDIYDRHDPSIIDSQGDKAQAILESASVFAGMSEPTPGNRLHEACWDLRRRFLQSATPKWFQRFVGSLKNHLTGSIEESTDATPLSLHDYLEIRYADAGMRPTMNMIEFAYDTYLSPEELEDQQIRRAQKDCALFASLSNDIFSYEKEVIAHQSNFNLIPVLMHQEGCGFQVAVHKAVEMVNGYAEDFLAVESEFEGRPLSESIANYVQGIRDQFIASWHWQMSTPRYRSPDSPFPELRSVPS